MGTFILVVVVALFLILFCALLLERGGGEGFVIFFLIFTLCSLGAFGAKVFAAMFVLLLIGGIFFFVVTERKKEKSQCDRKNINQCKQPSAELKITRPPPVANHSLQDTSLLNHANDNQKTKKHVDVIESSFSGNVYQLIDSASVVYDKVKYYNQYQEELDNFLAHGVIPGVEVNTENCKKAFGMMYELFVGREFEKNNYSVQYNGIENGKKDCGIDLAVYKSRNEVILVQCKYWRDSLIDCDVVSRMCGARELYLYQWLQQYYIPSCKLSCLIVTSSKLTEDAKKFAHHQSIDFVEEKTMDPNSIPWIKGTWGGKFYLPWDKNYIKFSVRLKYFYKILDAVEKGCNIRGDESDTPGVIID
jgi:hypothetical protein